MILSRMQRVHAGAFLIIALPLLFPGNELFARGGGQTWGYHPPAGAPLTNYWRFASPYGALQGWGIPHHSLDAPRLGSGSPSVSVGVNNSGAQFPTIDRSVEFPGASSNTSSPLPSFQHDIPARPYQTNKKFDPPYFHNYNGYWHHGYWVKREWHSID